MGLVSTRHQEVFVFHLRDLSAAEEPILILCLVPFQKELFLEVPRSV